MAITRSSSSPSPVLKQKSKMGKKSLANKSKGKRPIIDDFDSDFEAPMPKRVRPHSSKKTKLNLEEHTLPEISGKKFQKSITHAEDRTEVMCFVFVFGVFNQSSVWDCKFSPSDFYRSKCVCTSVYSCFLLSNTPDKEVSRFVLDVVDSGRWDEYCWGRESFELTIDSFKESFIFYSRDSNLSNTIVTKNPTLRDLKGKIFYLPLEKLKIKNMRPTDEERQQLQLDGLFIDESIDERGVAKQSFEGGSSSKKSDSADIDWMKSKLEMLISNQSSLAEDFISLRCQVTVVSSADVNPSEDVGGSDKNVKDVEKPKGDESRLKGDDFFDGLSQLVIDDDQVVLAGLEAVAKINVPAPNPDVVGGKSDALHTDEEAEDTVSDTPLLDKRKRAPALKSPFVDFGSADVGSTPMELMSSGSQSAGDDRDFKMVTYVKGLYALNDAFADPVSTEIEAKFDSWIGEGLLKHPRSLFLLNLFLYYFFFQFYSCFNAIFLLFFCCCRHYNCYEDGAKKFTPSFRLGVDYVEDKTWFYHLATCDMFMNDSHMNTIFYYLRKKGKYSSAVTLNFATTDCLFDDSIQALYHKFNKAKSMKTKMSHIHAAHPIAHYI
ncbi:uncharacterized protein LOC133036785 [Cannabis sativa]|uniref:uncharacterized protein LOC133036785 n=1 Tax=Cannabis sativa TaxID=3483 RepID=UPI0029C9D518|nr:uncharacterized protein LOC133036785 [Cannabis sativa]